jgi:hypothetical protein
MSGTTTRCLLALGTTVAALVAALPATGAPAAFPTADDVVTQRGKGPGAVTIVRSTAGPEANVAGQSVAAVRSRMPQLPRGTTLPSVGTNAAPIGKAGTRSADAGVGPAAYGTSRHAFTTSRVANSRIGAGSGVLDNHPTSGLPYAASGKLYMGFGSGTGYQFVCSASLIGRGLVVTAAHCVSQFGQGSSGIARRIAFVPAANSSSVGGVTGGPYGTWTHSAVLVPTAYVNGTDSCWSSAPGVVCANDVATILLQPRSGALPYVPIKGFYGYGWNGYGYATGPSLISNAFLSQITQMGYPVALNSGTKMLRNDSAGVFFQPQAGVYNQVIGSAMTGGSSGGPWMVNFGRSPVFGPGSSPGSAAARNIVVGTTSWGYTDPAVKQQGASWFGQNAQFPDANYVGGGIGYGAGNIGALVKVACFDAGGKASGKCFTAS